MPSRSSTSWEGYRGRLKCIAVFSGVIFMIVLLYIFTPSSSTHHQDPFPSKADAFAPKDHANRNTRGRRHANRPRNTTITVSHKIKGENAGQTPVKSAGFSQTETAHHSPTTTTAMAMRPKPKMPGGRHSWRCHNRKYRLLLRNEKNFMNRPRELPLLNNDLLSTLLIVPVQFRADTPAFKMALPHPCVDADNVVGEWLESGSFQSGGMEFCSVFNALLRPAAAATPAEAASPRAPLVIDVGANLGFYTLFSASVGARVISIELQTRWAVAIEHSALANGWLRTGQVTVQNVALGSQGDVGSSLRCVGKERTPHHQSHALHSPGDCERAEGVVAARGGGRGGDPTVDLVPFATLESLVPKDEKVRLLKLDCDGCEDGAYEGMRPLLEQRRVDFVMAESGSGDVFPNERDGTDSWFVKMVKRYRPQMYIASLRYSMEDGKLPSDTSCSTFAGLQAEEARDDFYGRVSEFAEAVGAVRPGDVSRTKGYVESFEVLEKYLRACEHVHVQIDILLDFREK